jgi:predicted aspartyl protease
MRKLILAAAVLMLAGGPALAEEKKCQLIQLASLDMIPGAPHILVTASVNGQPLTMMVDTGGWATALTESKAKQLGLSVETHPGSRMAIFGGIQLKHFTTFAGFTLGRMRAPTLTYPLLPDGFLPPDVDGILSPDFLANFDLDFDFANGKLNLFSRDHCEGKVVYWTKEPVAKIALSRPDAAHITIPVTLDGHEIKALVDTGGGGSAVMSLDVAEDLFDLKDDDPKLETVPGPNGIKTARKYPFKLLAFGDVQVLNPQIILVSDRDAQMGPRRPPMIIGIGILRQLHMYIDYHEKYLYVSAASQR